MDFEETSTCSKYNSTNTMRTTVPKTIVQGLNIAHKDKLVWYLKSTDNGEYSLSVSVKHQKID